MMLTKSVNLGVDCAFPCCHAVVRAVQRFVARDFEVVDGAIPTGKMEVVDGKPSVKHVFMWHSWLALKRNPQCIIDVVPLGSMPLFPSPVFLYLDEYAPDYVPRRLDDVVEMVEAVRDAEHMGHILAEELKKRQQNLKNAA